MGIIFKEVVPSTACLLLLGNPQAPITPVNVHMRRGSHHAGLWPGTGCRSGPFSRATLRPHPRAFISCWSNSRPQAQPLFPFLLSSLQLLGHT